MTGLLQPQMGIPELHAFLRREFPQVSAEYEVVELGPSRLRMGLSPDERHLRPGGTISGPTMFSLVDCAVYLAIIAHVGEEALAVTTSASIDFLRKPAAGRRLFADVTILKLGKRLAVGDAVIRNDGSEAALARATLTYSRP